MGSASGEQPSKAVLPYTGLGKPSPLHGGCPPRGFCRTPSRKRSFVNARANLPLHTTHLCIISFLYTNIKNKHNKTNASYNNMK